MKIVPYLALFFALTVWGSIASAHMNGASLEATSTSYVIDIGYDPATFKVGDSTVFNFNLLNVSRQTQSFDHVWVRILQNNKTELATGIHAQPIGPTTMLYVFPGGGTYTLDVSYRMNDGEEIATASFPISVSYAEDQTSPVLFVTFALGGLIGAVLLHFGSRTVASRSGTISQ